MALFAKLWTDILGDPKLMRAARNGAKHLALLPWLIVWAKRADDDGRLSIGGEPADAEDIARDIPNVTARQVAQAMAELVELGVLVTDADQVIRFGNWKARANYIKPSDAPERIAQRVGKHRSKKRPEKREGNADGNALQGVSETPIEQDEETEQEGVSVAPSEQNTYTPASSVALAPEGARSTSADVRSGRPEPIGDIDVSRFVAGKIPGDAPTTRTELDAQGRAVSKAYAEGLQRAVAEWKILHPDEYAVLERAECATRAIAAPPVAGGMQRQFFDAAVIERVRDTLKWPTQEVWTEEKRKRGQLDSILAGAA